MRWDENQKRLYCNRNPSACVSVCPATADRSRRTVEHYRIRNHFNPIAAGRLLRALRTAYPTNVTGMTPRLLSKAHLRLEKGESGDIRSLPLTTTSGEGIDVFRNNFAGKINRQTTEAAWAVDTGLNIRYESDQHTAQHGVQHSARNSVLREERKAQRHAERSSDGRL